METAGYAVNRANDGEDALYLGQTGEYDPVILDLGLPLLSGIQVLEGWRGEGRTMPVLSLTARGTWREKVLGLEAGADDYLTKPFHPEELLVRPGALLRRAHGRAVPEITSKALTRMHFDDGRSLRSRSWWDHPFEKVVLLTPGEVAQGVRTGPRGQRLLLRSAGYEKQGGDCCGADLDRLPRYARTSSVSMPARSAGCARTSPA